MPRPMPPRVQVGKGLLEGRGLAHGTLKAAEELVRAGRPQGGQVVGTGALGPPCSPAWHPEAIPSKGRTFPRLPLSEVLKAQLAPAVWLPNSNPSL